MKMSETSQVVYRAGERVETTGVTNDKEKESEPSQVVYIGGKKYGIGQDSTKDNGHQTMSKSTQSPSSTDADIVENLNNVNYDAPEPPQVICSSGKKTKDVEELTNELIEPAISNEVEDTFHVADLRDAQQRIPQKEDIQAINSDKQDFVEENISLHNFLVTDVPVDLIEQITEENRGKNITAEMSNTVSVPDESGAEILSNENEQPERLGKAQSPSILDENSVSNFVHDASDPFQVYIAGKITEKMAKLTNEAIQPADTVEATIQVSDPGCEQQKLMQWGEETQAIEIKNKEQDSMEDFQPLKIVQVMDVSGDASEIISEKNIGNPINSDTSKIIFEQEENSAETPMFKARIQITPEEKIISENNPENIPQPQNIRPVTSKSIYIKPEEPEPENENIETTTETNLPQERSTFTLDIENGDKDTSEKIHPDSTAVENSESDTLSDKSDSTASINSSVEDIQNASKTGVANPTFINVDDDVLKEIEKKNKRIIFQSLENNEKSLAADEGNGLIPKLDKTSPPIMADDTQNAIAKKEYSEYFIPENEKTKSFRGETEPLYETKSKDQGNPNWGKMCCWLFIIALLAGAITVGVLIGIGVINLEPLRQIKESRKLDTEPTNKDKAKLFEVKGADAPNVLTNDPDFFAPKNISSQGQESEPGNISETDINNNTSKDTKPENSIDTSAQKVKSEADILLPAKVTSTETATSTEPKDIIELTTYVPVENASKSDIVEVSTGSMSILKQEHAEKETTFESQQVIVEATEETTNASDLGNKANKLPSEKAFELLKAEKNLMATTGKVIPENESNTKSVNDRTNEEGEIIFPETDPGNPSLSDIVTEQLLTTTTTTTSGGGKDVKFRDNFTEVIDIKVSEPRELVLPEA